MTGPLRKRAREPLERKYNYGRVRLVIPLLTQGETPLEAPEGGRGRKLLCARYMRCLDYAAALGWDGWHCRRCPIDEERPAEELLREVASLLRFAEEQGIEP